MIRIVGMSKTATKIEIVIMVKAMVNFEIMYLIPKIWINIITRPIINAIITKLKMTTKASTMVTIMKLPKIFMPT